MVHEASGSNHMSENGYERQSEEELECMHLLYAVVQTKPDFPEDSEGGRHSTTSFIVCVCNRGQSWQLTTALFQTVSSEDYDGLGCVGSRTAEVNKKPCLIVGCQARRKQI